jgi:hypothetical protein
MSSAPSPADAVIVADRRFDPDSAFWDEFVHTYWGRRPVVIRSPFPEPMVDGDAAFRAMTAACDAFRAQSDVPQLRVNVDGGFLLADMEDRLPYASDRSFRGYAERLAPWRAGRPFLVTLNELQRYDVAFWKRMRKWLRGLYVRVGLPSGTLLTNLWFGTYERTPFGIHTDHAETFTYVIEGAKTLLVWPPEAFSGRRVYHTPGGDHLGTVRYEPYLGQAIELAGAPGDLLYWPEGYWHIGVSRTAAPTVTCNWAYINREKPRGEAIDFVGRELLDLARAALGDGGSVDAYAMDPGRIEEIARTLPPAVERSREAVRALASGSHFDEALRSAWLCRLTGFGFGSAPVFPEPITLREEDVVRSENEPIVCVPGAEGYLVSASGFAFAVPFEPGFPELVSRLNSGESRSVRDLESGLRLRGDSAARARLLLEELAQVYALSRVG